MNEKELTELGTRMVQKQIELAKVKGNKGQVGDIVNREAEVIHLKREFNQELDKLAKVAKVRIAGSE